MTPLVSWAGGHHRCRRQIQAAKVVLFQSRRPYRQGHPPAGDTVLFITNHELLPEVSRCSAPGCEDDTESLSGCGGESLSSGLHSHMNESQAPRRGLVG